MVKMVRFFLYSLFFLFMLVLFLPKENLYYFAQQQLQPYNLVINEENVEQKPLSLVIEKADIFFQKLAVAKVQKIDFLLFGLYNHIDLQNVVLSSLSDSFVPSHIVSADAFYSVLHPFSVLLYAKGDFGSLEGNYNIKTHVIILHLKVSKRMLREYKNTLKMLKKSKDGEYIYENTL